MAIDNETEFSAEHFSVAGAVPAASAGVAVDADPAGVPVTNTGGVDGTLNMARDRLVQLSSLVMRALPTDDVAGHIAEMTRLTAVVSALTAAAQAAQVTAAAATVATAAAASPVVAAATPGGAHADSHAVDHAVGRLPVSAVEQFRRGTQVRPWLQAIEARYALVTPGREPPVAYALTALSSEVLELWNRVYPPGSDPSWTDFTEYMQRHFGEHVTDDEVMSKLRQLRQRPDGKVAVYAAEFQQLLARLSVPLPMAEQIRLFRNNLLQRMFSETRRDVHGAEWTDLKDLIDYAIDIDNDLRQYRTYQRETGMPSDGGAGRGGQGRGNVPRPQRQGHSGMSLGRGGSAGNHGGHRRFPDSRGNPRGQHTRFQPYSRPPMYGGRGGPGLSGSASAPSVAQSGAGPVRTTGQGPQSQAAVVCFKCNTPGHKANVCPQRTQARPQAPGGSQPSAGGRGRGNGSRR